MKLDGVLAGYGKKIVAGGVTLEIEKGKIITLIGPNGGGKSTLIKSISGSLKLIGGSVYIDDSDLDEMTAKEISRTLSVVTTERVKPVLMTCKDVVMSGRIPYTGALGVFGPEDEKETLRALELMNISHLSDVPFSDMSDGQKQRTLIARAIAQTPEYLIMDEPTSYMDIKHRLELLKVIKELAGTGITIVMSLHELELALEVSDRLLLVYDDGHVLVRTPEEVITQGLLKELFDLSEDMYKKVIGGLGSMEPWQEKEKSPETTKGQSDEKKHCTYFVNRQCEYYPCHDVSDDKFSCLFCYCPLYDVKDCGGEYFVNEKGIKNCKNCGFVHDRDNYPKVLKKLKEKMYGEG